MFKFNFGFSGEKFLLLEISAQAISGLSLCLDLGKKVTPGKIWHDLESKKFPFLVQGIGPVGKVIIAVGPELAYTTVIPIELERENSEKALEATELENLLAKTIGRIFNQYRREASQVLGVDELNVILADSRVTHFKIENHRVIDPLGFQAKAIQTVLEMTFTTRDIFYKAKHFLNNSNDFFFTEIGKAQIRTIEKINPGPFHLLLTGDTSYLFSLKETAAGRLVFRNLLHWSTSAFSKTISKHWLVSETAGEELYTMYLRGETSPAAEKYLKKIFSPVIDSLAMQIKKFKSTGVLYGDGERIPFSLSPYHRNMFEEFPFGAFFEKSGFTIDFNEWPSSPAHVFKQLAPFFEFYYDTSNKDINHWLRRRLHWLGSST